MSTKPYYFDWHNGVRVMIDRKTGKKTPVNEIVTNAARSGALVTMDQAIQNARKGSVIILVAVFGKKANVDLAKLNDSELDLNTSMMYRHEDFVDAIRFVEEGKVQLEPLKRAVFAFEDYNAAYEYIDNNRETTMKVIIDVDPEEE